MASWYGTALSPPSQISRWMMRTSRFPRTTTVAPGPRRRLRSSLYLVYVMQRSRRSMARFTRQLRGDHAGEAAAESYGDIEAARDAHQDWLRRIQETRQLFMARREGPGRLPGSGAERFGMGPTVVLGQNLTEVAGAVRDGAMANLATGDRKTGNGHRKAAGM